MVTERQLEIILAVVYEYITTGEPVGSRAISKRYLTGKSPATIRNEMADLEEMGYLWQPHTSAGRVPTSKAYRLYVDAILQRKPAPPQGLERWLKEIKKRRRNTEELLSYVSTLMSRTTRCFSVAAIGALGNMQPRRVDFVRLDSEHVMVLVVLEGGLVHHRVIAVPGDISQEKLDAAARKVNELIASRPWSEVRAVLYRQIRGELEDYFNACLAAIDELDAMALRQNYHLFARGASEILKLPNFQDVSRISAILALLEEEESLLRLLESYSLKEGLHVIIGEENAIEEMRDYSLLFNVVDAAGCRMILGLIGPLRMDYEGSIATLEAISKDLREDHM